MDDQKILDNAPLNDCLWPDCNQIDSNGRWSHRLPVIRSLADIKAIVELRKANAELEKERDQILKSALDSESNYCDLKDSLPAHNLEQQAKGLTDYAKVQEQGIAAVWMISAASTLLKQAKALKAGT